jgi:predicted metallopeptidase
MPTWEKADDLKELAINVINARPEVGHVDAERVLFLWEIQEIKGSALGRCYSLAGHPIKFYTNHAFAIVFYQAKTEALSPQQLALLMLHELLHIPALGDKLVDHDMKDFYQVITAAGVDFSWAEPGANVPDILKG